MWPFLFEPYPHFFITIFKHQNDFHMKHQLAKIINSLGVIFLIGMNMLAVLLPLNDKTTGELSAMYPNLFVPAGFTFAIWSLIYLLLITFVLYLWLGKKKEMVIEKIGFLFIINAIANGLWLVFWHYLMIKISFLVMLVLLSTLILMYKKLNVSYFSDSQSPWQAKVPISVYMGWISVATIANFTVVLVSSGVDQLSFGADTWAAIMLSIAILLALFFLYKKKDIFFAGVVTWASFGIYSKRIADSTTIDPNIEHVSYIGMYLLLISIVLTIVLGILNRNKTAKD